MNAQRLRILGALVLASALLLPPAAAEATKLFTTSLVVGAEEVSDGTNSLRNVTDLFTEEKIDELLGSDFNPFTDSFAAQLDLRGVPAYLTWDPSGGAALVFGVQGVFEVEFIATTYEEAFDQLEDWFKGDLETDLATDDALTLLLQELVAESPVDPFAGNPNSLQSRMLSWDYRLGSEGPFTSGDDRLDPATNLVGLGVEYGHFKGGPYSGELLELPIDYRINFRNPKWSLLMNLPITATFTEGQWSVLASGAFGAQYRPTDWWALTPLFRVGGAGSIDVGALGVLYGVTVTNAMRLYQWRGVQLTMGNMVGFTKSIDGVTIGDYTFSYDLTNPVLRNGGAVQGEFDAFGTRSGWKVFGSNMLLFGDELFAESQNEVGVQLSTLGTVGEKPYEAIGFSVSYLFAERYDALSLRLRFRF
jgi:hypothetical protein